MHVPVNYLWLWLVIASTLALIACGVFLSGLPTWARVTLGTVGGVLFVLAALVRLGLYFADTAKG